MITNMLAAADGKYVTFKTTHFSEFVLVNTASKKTPVTSDTESGTQQKEPPVTGSAATTESKAPETQAPSQAKPPKTGSDVHILVLAVLAVVTMTSIGFIAMDVKKQNKRK